MALTRCWRKFAKATAHWLPDEIESNLMLLTCELVNNSVLHGEVDESQTIEVELHATGSSLRAQVTDPGPGFDDHYLWNLVGNPMETTIAAARPPARRSRWRTVAQCSAAASPSPATASSPSQPAWSCSHCSSG